MNVRQGPHLLDVGEVFHALVNLLQILMCANDGYYIFGILFVFIFTLKNAIVDGVSLISSIVP